jgi:hypothetical protein
MKIYAHEMMKIVRTPVIAGIIVLCCAFNIFVTVTQESGAGYPNYVSNAALITGTSLDGGFASRLAALPEDADGFKAALAAETNAVYDVLDGYDILPVGEAYINVNNASGGIADTFRAKYAAMQSRITQAAEADESLSLYYAGSTYNLHKSLFRDVLGRILIEGMIIASLVSLYIFGFERSHNTGLTVYSTKTGRGIIRHKLAAALSSSILIYGALAVSSLGVYFALNDFSGIWGSNVSSCFNKLYDLVAGSRPFTTLGSFTVARYLLASIGVSVGLAAVSALFGAVIGITVANTYFGFLIVFGVNILCFAIPYICPSDSLPRFVFVLSPVWLWLKNLLWFTDGDMDTLWRNFECLGLSASLIICGILCFAAMQAFRRRSL